MEHALKYRTTKLIYRKHTQKRKTTMTATITQNPQKRRDKLIIMAEIIDIAKTGALKTQIMYKANLSFAQLTEYLQFLTKNNLLEKFTHNGKEVYEATQKGTDFSERQLQIIDMLNGEARRNGVKSPPATLMTRAKNFQLIGFSST
jgi:predicted transcriptional regulator